MQNWFLLIKPFMLLVSALKSTKLLLWFWNNFSKKDYDLCGPTSVRLILDFDGWLVGLTSVLIVVRSSNSLSISSPPCCSKRCFSTKAEHTWAQIFKGCTGAKFPKKVSSGRHFEILQILQENSTILKLF